jgi:hypothetical protein
MDANVPVDLNIDTLKREVTEAVEDAVSSMIICFLSLSHPLQ